VELLLQREVGVNFANNEGDTPLHCATSNDFVRIASLLAQNGADLYRENNKGWSPLEKASKNLKEVLLGTTTYSHLIALTFGYRWC